MENNSFILFGDIITPTQNRDIKSYKDSFLICEDGKCKGVYSSIPKEYSHLDIKDYKNKLIIPGLIDLHVHASQFQFRGTAMDVELMEWLDLHAFDEEAKYQNEDYAKKAYALFASEMKKSFTTRCVVFASLHKNGTEILMEEMEKTNLVSYVGLVEMNRLSPSFLCQETKQGLKDTEEYILYSKKFKNTYPIITPRFTPSCDNEMMEGISKLRKKYNLKVQSHLDENLNEIELVKDLEKNSKNYTDTYLKYDLFGGDYDCIMAHCIYNSEEEIELLKMNNVFVAHCPECNMNVISGIAPISKYLSLGINVGLGSDVAGGSTLSLIRGMEYAIQVSKMYYRYVDKTYPVLNMKDAFYMATLGGGKFFGKVGAFEDNYEFDALVLDDKRIPTLKEFDLPSRLERFVYLGNETMILDKYVNGIRIDLEK